MGVQLVPSSQRSVRPSPLSSACTRSCEPTTADLKSELKEVKDEVKSSNAQTLAQLADATETRRIDTIPPADRTPQERDHIQKSPADRRNRGDDS